MASLRISDLSVSYPAEPDAVRRCNLEVADGELMVVLGPSGCGKTTMMRAIAGLVKPAAGDVLFDERSVLAIRPEQRGAVMVFQHHLLFPFRTVFENVSYGLRIHKIPKAERSGRVSAALHMVKLDGFEKRWPDELSGGQRQRVALARALVIEPKMLLLDEPLSNVDQHLRVELASTIKHVQRSLGITTLLVTHDQREAHTIADRVAVMVGGTICQVGTPADVAANPADPLIAKYFGPVE